MYHKVTDCPYTRPDQKQLFRLVNVIVQLVNLFHFFTRVLYCLLLEFTCINLLFCSVNVLVKTVILNREIVNTLF